MYGFDQNYLSTSIKIMLNPMWGVINYLYLFSSNFFRSRVRFPFGNFSVLLFPGVDACSLWLSPFGVPGSCTCAWCSGESCFCITALSLAAFERDLMSESFVAYCYKWNIESPSSMCKNTDLYVFLPQGVCFPFTFYMVFHHIIHPHSFRKFCDKLGWVIYTSIYENGPPNKKYLSPIYDYISFRL